MRMFLDQSECELRRFGQGGTTVTGLIPGRVPVHQSMTTTLPTDFLYRFRNYVQHVGLPLSIWSISISLVQSEELVRRAVSGELLPSDVAGVDAKDITILLGESPTNLVRNFDSWSTVKADLECLTTEIDLSEQISYRFRVSDTDSSGTPRTVQRRTLGRRECLHRDSRGSRRLCESSTACED